MLESKVKLDIEINKKCLQEETSNLVRKILELWLKYDYELLALIKEDKINER